MSEDDKDILACAVVAFVFVLVLLLAGILYSVFKQNEKKQVEEYDFVEIEEVVHDNQNNSDSR